ncbi:hypothetical protein HHI36_000075 [Cryptolaemus montrouzieri]|uniref:Uncharacterized protein n=1 Tax=Cryptolaemus montrouzieri TaxID=559131 RepID=A0ABD2P4M4_9CUCU
MLFSSQESVDDEQIEDSNDSIDFMTMQKINDIEKKYIIDKASDKLIDENKEDNISSDLNKDKEDKQNEFVIKVVEKCTDQEESETDIENDDETKRNDKNEIHIEGCDSETDIEKDENKQLNMEEIRVRTNSDEESETDIEKNKENCSASNASERKKRKVLKKKKRNNVFQDSESETDIEDEPKRESVEGGDQQNNMIDPTRTNFNTDLDSDANIENKGTSLHVNNSVISSILNDSERKDVEIIDETTLETSVMNSGHAHKKDLPEVDESLNDSDFIPATQDFGANNAKTVSQNSKFDYSEESFKLGLTQLMEEESEVRTSQEKTESNKKSEIDKTSQNSVGTKKFVFKKLNVITPIAVVPEVQDDGIYDVQTQKLCEDDKFDTSNDDHVFLQPTQTFTAKKKKSKDLAASEEDIYALSTQKYYESPEKSCVEDIYLQSTQKMSAPDLDVGKNTDLQSKEDFYQQSTQKLTEIEKPVTLNDDLEDMFASQAMSPKTTPSKCLESELECMFATQSAVPTEDSLDKIKDIILSKEIVDTKLPEEDSDLEAILATQRLLDSPKSSKVPEKPANKEAVLGRSIESQLEVIFASQVNNLPSDKFPRPANPLVNLFSEETQETDDFISNAEKKSDEHSISDMQNKSEVSECSSISRSCQNGLEQSFALLEAKSTRIRRSARSTNCEELVVTCPKSRKSMVIAPNEKEDENSVPVKTKRKRQPSISSEISKPETKESKRRSAKQTKKITDSLNVSDDDSRQSVGSNRSTRSNKTKDQNDDADSFASNSKLKNKSESNRNSDKDRGRSKSSNRSKKIDNNSDSSGDFETRKTKLKDDVKLAEVYDDDVSKINSSSRSGRMSRATKRLDKIQEIEDIEEGKVSLENLANKQKSEIKTNNKRKKLNVEDNEINEDKSIETTNNQEGSKEVASTRMNARTKTRIDIQEDTPKKKLPRSRKELNENCNSSNKNKDGRNSRNESRSSSSSSANENQKSTSLSGIKRGGTIEVTTLRKLGD